MDATTARQLWLVGEPIHALTYFSADAAAAWEAAGMRGFWRGYFATRAAPFGAVDAPVVTASFFNFQPAMVERAVPAVWSMVSPAAALDARLAGMDAALRSTVGSLVDDPRLHDVVAVLRDVVTGAPTAGRALFAANAALPWPTESHLALWHALTCLREHRGDGHNAALVAAGLDGCEAHVLAGAAGGTSRSVLQPARGWTDAEWDAAVDRLVERGLVRGDGAITDAGAALHGSVEATTDGLAAAVWTGVPDATATTMLDTLRPWAEAIHRSGQIRQPNPMGLPPV
ncbi:MAG: hypothetical protein M3Z03_15700 [Actinomycetota bacterium]|nr:hypothetical protein [Actinomycetota bacterium]